MVFSRRAHFTIEENHRFSQRKYVGVNPSTPKAKAFKRRQK